MHLDYWAETDSGVTRDHNEDNYLIDRDLELFVVADGMGGHAAGEVASLLCVQHVRDSIAKNRDSLAEYRSGQESGKRISGIVREAIQSACAAIYRASAADRDKRGMGTTCSLLLVVGQRGFIGHVGDSRIYLARQDHIHQLSEDHTLVNELLRRGEIRADEIDTSRYESIRNAVTRAVGVYQSVEVDTLELDILPGDSFLICSDGLHRYLDKNEDLGETLANEDIRDLSRGLIRFSNDAGGEDNITALVVRFSDDQAQDTRADDVALKLKVLQGMSIFRYLDYKELVRIMNIVEVRDFSDQMSIVDEGTMGEELFIILDGRIRLEKAGAFITTLTSGDHFGEMALVESAPRSVSALADGPTRLLVLSRKAFYRVMRNELRLSVKILWSLTQSMARRLRKTTADLSGARLESLPDLTEDVFFEQLSDNEKAGHKSSI